VEAAREQGRCAGLVEQPAAALEFQRRVIAGNQHGWYQAIGALKTVVANTAQHQPPGLPLGRLQFLGRGSVEFPNHAKGLLRSRSRLLDCGLDKRMAGMQRIELLRIIPAARYHRTALLESLGQAR